MRQHQVKVILWPDRLTNQVAQLERRALRHRLIGLPTARAVLRMPPPRVDRTSVASLTRGLPMALPCDLVLVGNSRAGQYGKPWNDLLSHFFCKPLICSLGVPRPWTPFDPPSARIGGSKP